MESRKAGAVSIEVDVVFFSAKINQSLEMPGPVHPYALKQLHERYQFNPADRPRLVSVIDKVDRFTKSSQVTYTDEEIREKFGGEEYNNLVKAREEKMEIARRFKSSEGARSDSEEQLAQ